MRCIAKINSSAVSFPSWSISERLLRGKTWKEKVRFKGLLFSVLIWRVKFKCTHHIVASWVWGRLDCIRIVRAWGPETQTYIKCRERHTHLHANITETWWQSTACECVWVPVRCPLIILSWELKSCLYFSLEDWGTAQSAGGWALGGGQQNKKQEWETNEIL